ncbi:MAG: cation-translocating P-type ATPase [Calditrichaeota bacterium]|nr:cation-translocating P-type ATPase [Calditrichota bacterium]
MATKTENLVVDGLHCADCAATIEKTVEKINGVAAVKANFTAGKVKITYDPHKVELRNLVEGVEKIGYRVASGSHKSIEKRQIWREREFQFTLVSGILLGLGLLFKFGSEIRIATANGRDISVSIVFFLAAVLPGAYYFVKGSWAAIKNRQFNMVLLMTVAILGAIVIGEYVEAASLAFLFSLAELLEGYAIERARNSLRQLMTLTPDTAQVKTGSKEKTVAVDKVQVGDILVARPGEKIALDGMVVDGISSVDQSPITGESVPVKKEPGDKVYAGAINNEGYLEIRVTQNSENSMIARIIQLVEDAESQKSPTERFVEKFARIYTPTVVLLAVGVATIPPIFLDAAFNLWFVKALTLLVIACPCALVISTPVSVVSALTSASRNGVLIKGGLYLEEMGRIKVLAFDKTGTLTLGRLQVTDVVSLNGAPEEELLRIAASLEKRSEHPIAKAILEAADGTELEEASRFEAIPGRGVRGELGGVGYAVGGQELFLQAETNGADKKLRTLQSAGKTTMLVGKESEIIGIIALSDKIRDDALAMVSRLKADGKQVVMITGDNEATAKSIAAELGITHYYANLLPDQKVKIVKQLQAEYGKVAVVGDGINDAPALAAASVGIAMGVAGSDTALETADVALMSDDLSKLPYLVELSRQANQVIRQNTLAAIVLKLSLALGVFPGLVSLVVAVLIGDMGASLGVIANALRLARFRPQN